MENRTMFGDELRFAYKEVVRPGRSDCHEEPVSNGGWMVRLRFGSAMIGVSLLHGDKAPTQSFGLEDFLHWVQVLRA